jgi:hypothetical protein
MSVVPEEDVPRPAIRVFVREVDVRAAAEVAATLSEPKL